MKSFVFFLTLNLALFSIASVPDEVIKFVQNGNSSALSSYFTNPVEVCVPGKEGNFNKNEAEKMLKDFFTKYPCKSINIQHKGNTTNPTFFYILQYQSNQNFRVKIIFKTAAEKTQLSAILIE